jgi:hypothetical protein
VNGVAPILNPRISANLGGDEAYLLQFSPGALVNTAGVGMTSWEAQMDIAMWSSTDSLLFRMATAFGRVKSPYTTTACIANVSS